MKIHRFASYHILLVAFSTIWFLLQASLTTGNLTIGVILDQTSRPGTEAKLTLMYESLHLASTALIISHLCQAFQQTEIELTHILPLTCGSCFLDEDLKALKRQQWKVSVIHASQELGVCVFQAAKKMEMTGDGYLWIATNGITDLFHSINSTMISSRKGMVGVKTHFPENTPAFLDFRKGFSQKFLSDYLEQEHGEPGNFAVQGYNAVKLLQKVSAENFDHKIPLPQKNQSFQRPLNLRYDYFPVYVSYNGLTGLIPAKKFDVTTGDVRIASSWHEYLDFTEPYTESGLEMIIPNRSRLLNRLRLFMKPLTAKLWLTIAATTLYTGFVIWLIERPSKMQWLIAEIARLYNDFIIWLIKRPHYDYLYIQVMQGTRKRQSKRQNERYRDTIGCDDRIKLCIGQRFHRRAEVPQHRARHGAA